MELFIIVISGGLLIILIAYIGNMMGEREHSFISYYIFPKKITEAIGQEYPHLSLSEKSEVIKQMREYFHFQKEYNNNNKTYMPSLVLLFCLKKFSEMNQYQLFLKKSGSLYFEEKLILSDSNATAEQYDNYTNMKVSEIWAYCCKKEKIDPFFPLSTPSLFTLDERLKIPSGFSYKRDEEIFKTLIHFSEFIHLDNLKKEFLESENIDALRKKAIFYFGNANYCKQYEASDITKVFNLIRGNQELTKNINEQLVRGLDSLEERAVRDSKAKEDSGSSCGGCG